jgi:hypothetical protein
MTCRYAHKRIATLFSAVQAPVAARIIEWPQKLHASLDQRGRAAANGKSQREGIYASK